MKRQCGTCGRWDAGRQIGQDYFLGGKCGLNDKDRGPGEMQGCLGWKEPTPGQLTQRISAGKIGEEDINA